MRGAFRPSRCALNRLQVPAFNGTLVTLKLRKPPEGGLVCRVFPTEPMVSQPPDPVKQIEPWTLGPEPPH